MVRIAVLLCLVTTASAQEELKALNGKWVSTHLEYKGQAIPRGDAHSELTIEDGKAVHVSFSPNGERTLKLSLAFDSSRSPKTIDYIYEDGPLEGQKQLGIYKLEADKLIICMAKPMAPEDDRPAEFITADKPYTMVVFERKKD